MGALIRLVKALASPWTWTMAWRDSRRTRRRLLLYSCSIVLGVAALVAVGSFGDNLDNAIQAQAKSLLGADLAIISRAEFSEPEEDFLRGLGGRQAREISFSSMIYFPRSESTRLAQIRALEGDFPFYGTLESVPEEASGQLRHGSGALVEESLLKQFGLSVGDQIKLGESMFAITGSLRNVPGEIAAFGTFAPRVYIALKDVPGTELLQTGSLVRHKIYFDFGSDVQVPRLVKKIRPVLDKYGLEADTVERRTRNLGRAMSHLEHFLNLVGLVALLLGGIGIASAIYVHVKQKLSTVAVLRSLGCTAMQAFAIYLAQAVVLGVIGVTTGAALGLAIQRSLPAVLADFLPLQFAAAISWPALARGAGLGLLLSLLFALLPLLTVRRVPPLAALRSFVEPPIMGTTDPLKWGCYAVIGGSLLAFCIVQSQDWRVGLGFAAGIGVAFALLTGVARVIVYCVRRHLTAWGPFTWRQGLASLSRPNNRTLLLLISVGLGVFLILTLYLVQTNLIGQLLPQRQETQPDAVLFDIQSDQREGVAELLASQQLPILQEVPVVTMRLSEVGGRKVERLRKDPRRPIPNWALRREYRSTYRDHLEDSEKLVAGTWHAKVEGDPPAIPVSVEEGIATTLNVGLGDELVFDVQGVPIRTVIASLREVDWRRVQPNFFVVFPAGALEEAPAFHILVTRAGSSEKSAQLQRELVKQFPNVSAVDLTLVLQTVESVLGKIAFVIRFMALFTVGTGLIVLVASVLTGRHQRLQESVLLRTLGASRRQVLQILVVEYLCLGTLAALTGILLAAAASWALTVFVFKMGHTLPILPLLVTVLIVAGLTVCIGLLTSRGISKQPPLEVLRNEV